MTSMTTMTTMTTRCVQPCGMNSMVKYFNVKTYDIWEGNVTTKRKIWIEHIRSLEFWIIREGVMEGDIVEDKVSHLPRFLLFQSWYNVTSDLPTSLSQKWTLSYIYIYIMFSFMPFVDRREFHQRQETTHPLGMICNVGHMKVQAYSNDVDR